MSQSGNIPASQKTDGVYKSQLQELCQRKSWPLPEYKTVKEGPIHGPHFKATVVVNGLAFESPDVFKRAKDAQIEAAKLALAHFTSSASDGGTAAGRSPAASGVEGVSATRVNLGKRPMADEIETPIVKEEAQNFEKNLDTNSNKHGGGVDGVSATSINLGKRPMAGDIETPVVKEESQNSERTLDANCKKHAEELHIYKNQLQSIALKKGYGLPTYTYESEGPPHSCRFKSKVSVNGQVYESHDFFHTLKESEHAAAKVALTSLVPHESQDAIIDKSVFKNLLQELAQKSGMNLPIYNTTSSGAGHMPTFVSTVLVNGETFYGEEAKTKKHAEMNVAEIAYTCLSQRDIPGPSGRAFISVPKHASASNVQACTTANLGAISQIGAPSKLIPSQIDTGHPKCGHQQAPKQNPQCAVSMNANPKDLPEQIPFSQGKDSLPITLSEELHGSGPVSIADIFTGSSSSPCNVVRVYPKSLKMITPDGAVVQHTDDKWIAVKFPASQAGH